MQTAKIIPSPNNPCPFLRTLVAQGLLPDKQASIQQVTEAIEQIMALSETFMLGHHADLPLKSILAVANGISPKQVAHNVIKGVRLDQLRFGPFYKHGNSSRILDEQGEFNVKEFERLKSFASLKVSQNGQTELGLNLSEIHEMLHANLERATGKRKYIDRGIMEAEIPALLAVFGKPSQSDNSKKGERYLAVDDVERLFKLLEFPPNVQQALNK